MNEQLKHLFHLSQSHFLSLLLNLPKLGNFLFPMLFHKVFEQINNFYQHNILNSNNHLILQVLESNLFLLLFKCNKNCSIYSFQFQYLFRKRVPWNSWLKDLNDLATILTCKYYSIWSLSYHLRCFILKMSLCTPFCKIVRLLRFPQ